MGFGNASMMFSIFLSVLGTWGCISERRFPKGMEWVMIVPGYLVIGLLCYIHM